MTAISWVKDGWKFTYDKTKFPPLTSVPFTQHTAEQGTYTMLGNDGTVTAVNTSTGQIGQAGPASPTSNALLPLLFLGGGILLLGGLK